MKKLFFVPILAALESESELSLLPINNRIRINLRLNGHTSFEFQTRNYITCFGRICNHPHGQENHNDRNT